jgi:hypothetical protein
MDEIELIRLQGITKQYVEASLKTYSNYVVYGLIDPNLKIVRYIGNTIKGIKQRKNAHLYNARKTNSPKHVTRWIRKLLSEGSEPNEIVIGQYPTIEELNAAERRLIKEFWDMGFPLTNGTEGGDLNLLTEEVRKRIGITQSQRMTPEVRAKMSADALRLCSTPEHYTKLSKGQIKRFEREEELEKNRIRALSQYATPERKYEQVRKMNAGKSTPEARKNYSEGAKQRHKRPEEKELNSQRLKKYFSKLANRQKLSESIKKLWEKPEIKAKYLTALAEGRNKPEAKLNRSIGQKRRFNPTTEAGRLERLKTRERTLQVYRDRNQLNSR